MNVTTVQSEVRSPAGQRGADTIRRPPAGGQQSAPQSQAQGGIGGGSDGKGERPISRGDIASQPYPYQQNQPAINPPAAPQNQSGAERQNFEQGENNPGEQESAEPGPGEWSQRYAQIQRRERQIYQHSQNLQRFEQQLREREARVREHEETQGLAKSDPKQFIEKNGLSYEQLTDIYLNDGKPTSEQQIKSLHDEIRALQQRLDNEQTQGKEIEAQKQIDGFKRDIRGTIAKEGDRFQLIQARDAYDTVFQVIESYFAKTKADTGFGILLPISEAAEYVERDLYDEAQKLLSLPKFKRQPDAEEIQGQQPLPRESPQHGSQPQRTIQRQQQSSYGQNSIIRDQSGIVGGINNLSYAQQTKKMAANMLRFNR